MPRPLLQVEGARELRRTLSASADGLEDLKAANARAAATVEARARSTAPRKTGTLVGTLRSSGTKTAGYVRAGYARTPYPGVIEWGYASGYPIEGQNYLTEAARSAEPQWIPEYEKDLETALRKVKGK